MLKLDEFLELLLLELIADQLNVLSKVSNLGNLLLFGLSQLLIDVLYILFHFFLGLKKALAVSLVLREVIGRHVACIRFGIQIALIKGILIAQRRKNSHMKRGLLLGDIRNLVCTSLCQESVLLLGACHASSNFNFDVNFNVL